MTVRGFVHLTAATLTYGGLHVIDKAALRGGADVSAYTVSRVFIAALILFIFAAATCPRSLSRVVEKGTIRDLVLIGVLASGWGLLLQITGLARTTAINAGLLLTLVAPGTTIFAVWLLGEPLTKSLILASLLMLGGVWSIYGLDKTTAFGFGDILILIAALGYAYSNVHARKTMKNTETTIVTLGRLIFGALSIAILLPFVPLNFSSLASQPALVLLGGAVFGIRMVTYYKGIALEGASVAATFLLFSPVVTALSAHFFLAEPLSPGIAAGIALTLAGGWLLISSASSASS